MLNITLYEIRNFLENLSDYSVMDITLYDIKNNILDISLNDIDNYKGAPEYDVTMGDFRRDFLGTDFIDNFIIDSKNYTVKIYLREYADEIVNAFTGEGID